MKKQKLVRLVLVAMFAALTAVMTVTPYFGYISYGGVIEITTLHIAVILGACILGGKSGAVIGGIWGVTCLLRALTNVAAWGLFVNPLISVLPRIIVGLVAGLLFTLLKKTKLPKAVSLGITAALATVTNTVLVLSAIKLFGKTVNLYANLYELVSGIFSVLIGVNGLIELVAAILLVPTLYLATERFFKDKI